MKTTFCLFISFTLWMNYSMAQKASFGITAGATFASYKATVEDLSLTSDTKTGFNIGLVSSVPLSKSISFRPELKYVQKGGKMEEEGLSDKLNLNYIELPLNFVFNAGNSKGMLFAGAGPSLNIGIGGTSKWDDGVETGDEDIKFGSTADKDFKPLEIGANIIAGYQFANGFFISANYNTSLSNILHDDNDPE